MGKQIYYITNNCTRSPEFIKNRLTQYGYHASDSQIYISSTILANYIRARHQEIKKIYCIGSPALVQEFRRLSFDVVDSAIHNESKINHEKF